MILRRAWIENLFSYRGRHEFDLTRPPGSNDRNVVLIHARNGQGKTSFLNSMKLLFGGVTDRIRGEVVPGSTFKQNEFMKGRPPTWWGAFHRAVRDPGQEYAVGAEWDSAQGVTSVERRWRMGTNGDPDEPLGTLTWRSSAREALTGKEARVQLETLFPAFALPFFFFDGEQIMALSADHAATKIEQVKLLLNLAPLEALQGRVGVVRKEWEREGLNGVSTGELEQLEAEVQKRRGEEKQLRERHRRQEAREKELKDQIDRLDLELKPHRRVTVAEDKSKLQGKADLIAEGIREDERAIALQLPVKAHLLFNPDLMRGTVEALQREAGTVVSEATTTTLNRLSEQLDRDLFAVPPSYDQPLTERQVRFYKDRLKRIIELSLPRPDPDHLQISPGDRQRAARQLEELAQNNDERRRWQATLSRYLKRIHELSDLTAQIEELAVEDEDQRKRVADLAQQRDALRDELASVRADLEQIRARIKALEAEIASADRALDEARRRAESTAAADRRATLARRVERLLGELVPMTFERRKRELEERVNQRLSELLTSNTLIHRVQFSANLDHRFLDRNGREIGTGSVSAGMKQLYAMAFLWALIDASQRTLPVVVDTPLSRLDQEHQERLLTHFFPRLGQQVIILPTNSELDRAKYELIRPYVYRQYRLEISPGGDETTQRELDMYPGARP